MHEMAWITTQGQAVGRVKLAARVNAHGNDVMNLQAAPSLSACPARGVAGQVLRTNAGPLAGSPDFGGLEQFSEESEHGHIPHGVGSGCGIKASSIPCLDTQTAP